MTRQSNFRIVGHHQDGGDKVVIVVKAIDREKARSEARTRGIRISELIRVVKQHGRWKVLPDQRASEIDDEPEPPPIIRDVAKPDTGQRPDRFSEATAVAFAVGEAVTKVMVGIAIVLLTIVTAMGHHKFGRIILFVAVVSLLVWLNSPPESQETPLPPLLSTSSLPQIGQIYRTRESYFFARSGATLQKLRDLHGDRDAFNLYFKQMLLIGELKRFDAGTTVTVLNVKIWSDSAEVRVKGEPDEYWVMHTWLD